MTEEKTRTMIPLKDGVSINHKAKRYKVWIPEEIFKEIYGNLGKDPAESEKLYKERVKKVKPEPKKEEAEPEKPKK